MERDVCEEPCQGTSSPVVAFSGLNKADIMLAIRECKLGLVPGSSAPPSTGNVAGNFVTAAADVAAAPAAPAAPVTSSCKEGVTFDEPEVDDIPTYQSNGAGGTSSRAPGEGADMHKFLGVQLAAMQLQVSAVRDLCLGRVGKGVDEAMGKLDTALSRLCADLGYTPPPFASNAARQSCASSGRLSAAAPPRRGSPFVSEAPPVPKEEGAFLDEGEVSQCLPASLPGAVTRNGGATDEPASPMPISPTLSWDPAIAKDAAEPTRSASVSTSFNKSSRHQQSVRSFTVLPVWEGAILKAKERRSLGDGDLFMNNVVLPSHGFAEASATRSTTKMRERRTGTKHKQRPIDQWFMWAEMHLWMLILNPNSTRRVAWDIGSLCFIMYDLFVIPLQLFDPPENQVMSFFAWATRVFWTLDMFASSFTGYVTPDGNVELHPLKVVWRYLRSWFMLDFVIIAMDWVELLYGSSSGNMSGIVRFGKASRTFRALRMLRLLRLVRIRQIMQQFTERVQSEQLMITLNLTKLMALITSAAHVLSCLWYGIGTHPPRDYSHTWVVDQDLESRSFWYKYTTSLHWAFSQFTGGMEDIVPVNLYERVFAIFALMVAFVGATVFMSALTSWLTQLHILWSKQSRQLALLRRYLTRINVSTSLAMRVQRNAQYVLFERTQNTPEEAVDLLDVISEPLRMELHYEMYLPVFLPHPFLGPYMRLCPQVMRKVCHHAAKTIPIACGDVIFHAGESPEEPKMYFLLSGRLQYMASCGDLVSLEPGDWIAEATLWVDWTHRGLLKAVSDGQICTLSAVEFQRIVSTFEHDSEFTPGTYAEEFVQNLNSSPASGVLDVTPKEEVDNGDAVKTWFTATFARRHHHDRKGHQVSVRERSSFDGISPPS